MAVVAQSSLQTQHGLRSDIERDTVACLIRTAGEAGVRADPISIVNFYVALKSKPLAILTGPAQHGKIALVQSLAQVLTGGDPLQCQMMVGHAWWAEHSGDVALFTEAQTRLNTDKIFALIEEALQPENVSRVFIAYLTRISPAELTDSFSEVASQLRHGQIMRLSSIHLTEPIPYPPNLFLIGTMDTARFDTWSDSDLLSGTTIIQWSAVEAGPAPHRSQTAAIPGGESEFLRSCIRSEQAAYLKLQRILGWRSQAIWPLLQIGDLLKKHAVQLPGAVMGEAMVYLANAWSKEGDSLFDQAPSRNLAIALDLVMTQTLLPRVCGVIRNSAALRRQLRGALNGQFPRAVAFLESLD